MARRSNVRPYAYDFQGYTDIVSPARSIPDGTAIASKNFEPDLHRGFRRINGFERFDGQAKPSDAAYYVMCVSELNGDWYNDENPLPQVAVSGMTITGDTSGASAEILYIDVDEQLIVTAVDGTFQLGEDTDDGLGITVDCLPVISGEDDTTLHNTYLLAARDYYRDLIAVVPGSGDVLGVFRHEATVYAFRANAGNTETDVYKSTSSGWSKVTLGHTIAFDAGTGTEIAEQDTITGATSAATATVERVITQAGSWGVDAEGYLVLSGVSGTFQNNENLEVSASVAAIADGANAAISLTVGGRYEFVSHNFFGSSATYRIYGCDGVNQGFEFDGSVYAPIDSNVSVDTPKYLVAHKSHLFFSYPGGRMAHSTPGEPMLFSGLLGAAEFGLGAEITGFASQPNDVLGIATQRQTYGLYGTSVSDWELKLLSKDTGAMDYTLQIVGDTYGLDDRGVIQVSRTEAFGNFENATVSRLIQPYIDSIKSTVVASSVVRRRNQYRLYFSDGTGLVFNVIVRDDGSQGVKATAIDYNKVVTCISNAEDENGDETIFFGSTDGYVYEAERGASFDGEVIDSFLRTSFSHLGSPDLRKRFYSAVIELDSDQVVDLNIKPDLSYGGTDHSSPAVDDINITGTGGFYDNDDWDEIFWDAQIIVDGRVELTGTGKNIAFLIYNTSAVTDPFILQGAIIYYAPRRRQR